jgi:hypothetical protein
MMPDRGEQQGHAGAKIACFFTRWLFVKRIFPIVVTKNNKKCFWEKFVKGILSRFGPVNAKSEPIATSFCRFLLG